MPDEEVGRAEQGVANIGDYDSIFGDVAVQSLEEAFDGEFGARFWGEGADGWRMRNLPLECADMSALLIGTTCRAVQKRRRVAAVQRRASAKSES